MEKVIINPWERIDDLQYKGLHIIQDTRGFCFGIDAVLLANFANVKKSDKVIDLGTGTAIIPILIAGKTEAKHIVGLEIQSHMVDMAKRSVLLNKLEHRVEIVEGDLKEGTKIFGLGQFDVVTCNPPYMNQGGGKINSNDAKAISRHEIMCTLEDVIAVTAGLLKYGGRFYMVHRPERLVDILWLMRHYRIEPKKVRFVHPAAGKRANLLLIEGLKGGNPYLKMLEPLYVYNDNGEYSDEIHRIYNRKVTINEQ